MECLIYVYCLSYIKLMKVKEIWQWNFTSVVVDYGLNLQWKKKKHESREMTTTKVLILHESDRASCSYPQFESLFFRFCWWFNIWFLFLIMLIFLVKRPFILHVQDYRFIPLSYLFHLKKIIIMLHYTWNKNWKNLFFFRSLFILYIYNFYQQFHLNQVRAGKNQ